jgi:hypothetical protein
MGTKRTVIARLESGRAKPSTRTLERYAEATGRRLKISFEPALAGDAMPMTKRKPASVGEILTEEFMVHLDLHDPKEGERIDRARPLGVV